MAETQTTTVYNKIKAQIEGGEYSPAQSLTEAALAQEHGVSRNTINSIESGKYVPSTVLALKIARHFHKPVDSIFQLDEND